MKFSVDEKFETFNSFKTRQSRQHDVIGVVVRVFNSGCPTEKNLALIGIRTRDFQVSSQHCCQTSHLLIYSSEFGLKLSHSAIKSTREI
jgi:hypothetical protein